MDGVSWQQYESGLEERLIDLHSRVHRGAYRAQPSRRVYIPKADGRQRPLGIASLEDKIVQQAVVTILNQIYEVDFRGFSYGFRPGRSPHQALDALNVGIQRKRVNWILDADIRGFFDNMSHEWTMKFMEHRVADPRILRLIRKWLKAGVSEDGKWSETKVGTPQGAVISPLLANVYLHYVLDLWVEVWRRKVASGELIVVRYADDLVVGFQHREDAERFLREFRERLAAFELELHPEKTRLIDSGGSRRAHGNSVERENLKRSRSLGSRITARRTRKAISSSAARPWVNACEQRCRLSRHSCVSACMNQSMLSTWLKRVVEGYYRYHAVPENLRALRRFRERLRHMWRTMLGRRSQRSRPSWKRIHPTLCDGYRLPVSCIPILMFVLTPSIQGKSRVR